MIYLHKFLFEEIDIALPVAGLVCISYFIYIDTYAEVSLIELILL